MYHVLDRRKIKNNKTVNFYITILELIIDFKPTLCPRVA